MNFNKVVLLGNLTRDPELRYLPNGTAVADFGIATNRIYKDRTGVDKDEVCFVNVVAFAKQAETINQYLHKGDPLLIEGRLKYESWEDKQTKAPRNALKVALEGFQFIGSKRDRQSGPAGAPPPPPSSRMQPGGAPLSMAPATPTPIDESDDVPF